MRSNKLAQRIQNKQVGLDKLDRFGWTWVRQHRGGYGLDRLG